MKNIYFHICKAICLHSNENHHLPQLIVYLTSIEVLQQFFQSPIFDYQGTIKYSHDMRHSVTINNQINNKLIELKQLENMLAYTS